MNVITENLSMHYGKKMLFGNVCLNLKNNSRYGLVGANGAGKSTFLNIIKGLEEPSSGQVITPKNCLISMLKQDHYKYEQDRLVDVVIRGNEKLWNALKQKEKILAMEEITDENGLELAELEEVIALSDGYDAEVEAQMMLLGLGIDESKHFEPLSQLSGGYKLRVLLAQTLFGKPNVLLLDEPNNHLDIVSIDWLQNYLINQYKGMLVLISHDHAFLNNVVTHILDIDYETITEYVGNFDDYLEQKELRQMQKSAELKNLQKTIQKEKEFIERFGAKASKATQAKSREKKLAKIKLPEIKKSSRIFPNFTFTQERPSGKLVLEVENLAKSYEQKQILKSVNFKIDRGEKIAVIGENGVGKSTLLKIILGKEQADSGEVKMGAALNISYFAQSHHELLKGNYTIYSWLQEQNPTLTDNEIRGCLAKVLFTKDEVEKHISQISGGEAARLLLANISVKKPNMLILDEPTNHLDLEARIALAESLSEFVGTIMIVSHDRAFINSVAQRIIFIHKRGVIDFHGEYEDFREKYKKFFE
jgi:ATPase subunit of ABC transporter with duplicated ATPase domains